MVNPINIMTSGVAAAETGKKNAVRTAPDIAAATDNQVIFPSTPGSDEVGSVPEVKPAATEEAGKKGEFRRIELKDGQVTIKVYDNSGKLLRKTPPGYLPLGEQKCNIVV